METQLTVSLSCKWGSFTSLSAAFQCFVVFEISFSAYKINDFQPVVMSVACLHYYYNDFCIYSCTHLAKVAFIAAYPHQIILAGYPSVLWYHPRVVIRCKRDQHFTIRYSLKYYFKQTLCVSAWTCRSRTRVPQWIQPERLDLPSCQDIWTTKLRAFTR